MIISQYSKFKGCCSDSNGGIIFEVARIFCNVEYYLGQDAFMSFQRQVCPKNDGIGLPY